MHTGRMSRMRTSCASLLWARPAMRRACSRGVRAGSGPFFAASLAAVEAELGDRFGHRGRDEIVDGLAPRHAVAHVPRRDRQRLDLEEPDTVGSSEALEHTVESLSRISRARRDAEPGELEDAVWILPLEEVAELVGSDQESGVLPLAFAKRVDGSLVLVELDAEFRERGARKSEPRPGVELDALVAGLRGDEHDELLQPEVAHGGEREREVPVVRRVERPPEQARGHANSTISSPRSTSSPALAPAAFNASPSSSSSGSSPTTRKPRSVR